MSAMVIALVGAVGLVLAITGLPPLRGKSVDERVSPYLSGLRGRPSSLLARQPSSRSGLEARGIGASEIRCDNRQEPLASNSRGRARY